MPREEAILKRVRDYMKKNGAKCIKTSGEGEPDLVCAYRGQSIVIETKQPGEKPEPLQMIRLKEWAAAGAVALWTDNAKDYRMVRSPHEEKTHDRSVESR